jgi:hypothetical protein
METNPNEYEHIFDTSIDSQTLDLVLGGVISNSDDEEGSAGQGQGGVNVEENEQKSNQANLSVSLDSSEESEELKRQLFCLYKLKRDRTQ